jgi:phosphate:Na+ symporter
MADYAKEAVLVAIALLFAYDKKKAERVTSLEETVDFYEDKVGAYLLGIASRRMSKKDSQTMSVLLHSIGDFERISDHALSIRKSAKEMKDKEISFAEDIAAELRVLTGAVNDIVNTSFLAFQEEDIRLAEMIEPICTVIELLKEELRKNHIKRLRKGNYTIETGFIFSDIITNCGRIAAHCANIAVSMLQSEEKFDTHEYSRLVRGGEIGKYTAEVERLKKLYKLPQGR